MASCLPLLRVETILHGEARLRFKFEHIGAAQGQRFFSPGYAVLTRRKTLSLI